jgi:pimeloyl-ACP methyl ester carboxylesterase
MISAVESEIRSVTTPVAQIGYFEDGPTDGIPIILAHGFPDDARTWEHERPNV